MNCTHFEPLRTFLHKSLDYTTNAHKTLTANLHNFDDSHIFLFLHDCNDRNKVVICLLRRSVTTIDDYTKDGGLGMLSALKSVQSTLSHLQSPPEQTQSQRSYGSFLSKSHLDGMILQTMLAQNRPKVKDNALIEQFHISRSSISNRGKQL